MLNIKPLPPLTKVEMAPSNPIKYAMLRTFKVDQRKLRKNS